MACPTFMAGLGPEKRALKWLGPRCTEGPGAGRKQPECKTLKLTHSEGGKRTANQQRRQRMIREAEREAGLGSIREDEEGESFKEVL